MFGGVRVGRPRGPPRSQHLGVLLLAYHMFNQDAIPTVTLAAVILQACLFVGVLDFGWGPPSRTCLNAAAIIRGGEYSRLVTSALVHASDLHLYYNMVSLIYKGRLLERKMGTAPFAALLAFFTLLSGILHVALAFAAQEFFQDPSYLHECAVGFSGVLFALKVVVNDEGAGGVVRLPFVGLSVGALPSSLAVWAELLLIQLLVPNASFLGHAAGILAGIVYLNAGLPLTIAASPINVIRRFPSTLSLGCGLLALHLNLVEKPWPATRRFWSSVSSLVCLSSDHIVRRGAFAWIRLISAPLEHVSDVHFFVCLVSFLIKAYQLEAKESRSTFRASIYHCILTIISVPLTSVVYVLLTEMAFAATGDHSYVTECVQGLSGPLFALKVLCLFECESLWTPTALFELVEALILLEARTRTWHLAGLVTGLALVCFLTWRDSRRRFPAEGVRLGAHFGRSGSNASRGSSNAGAQWTRSWGYANQANSPFGNASDEPLLPDEWPPNPRQARSASSASSYRSNSYDDYIDDVDEDYAAALAESRRSYEAERGRATPIPSAPPFENELYRRGPPPPNYPGPFHPPPPDLEELRRRRSARFS